MLDASRPAGRESYGTPNADRGQPPSTATPVSSEGDAAVAEDRLAGHVGGLVAGEEEVQAGDVPGASEPAERNASDEFLFHLSRHRVEHLRLDGARRHAVDAHRVAGELLGERSRQSDDPGLAGGVVRLAPVAESGDGRGVGDDPAAALPEVGDEGPAGDEGAAQVDRQDALPVLDGEVGGEAVGDDAGVVDEDVGNPDPRDQLGESRLDGIGIADVDLPADEALVVRRFGVLSAGIPDLNAGALGAKEAYRGGPDAPRAAGDDSDPVLQQHSVASLLESGFFEYRGEALLDREPGDEDDPVVAGAVVGQQDLVDALAFGHEHIKDLVTMQEKLVAEVGKEKIKIEADEIDTELVAAVGELASDRIKEANRIPAKEERQGLIDEIRADILEGLAERFPEGAKQIKAEIEALLKADMRGMILKEKRRIDGRALDEVREVTCESSILPRTHGSALFTRGQTQALCVATLGTKLDERMADDLQGKRFKSYYLDYNFPAYSVGEVRFERGPGRRDIGHGHLAERAIEPVIPSDESFPYTIRLVADITESSSSSSMATVCGTSLALMDAGVPIQRPVAGIAMGLILENGEYAILSDILGDEDHLGDMDFKVAGTKDGITSLQMDIKITGITEEIMKAALEQAREGRIEILEEMANAIDTARADVSSNAPRITSISIPKEKIREVIGTGGKVIREICETTGAKIDIEDDGTIKVAAVDGEAGQAAVDWIKNIVAEPEVGVIYDGKVVKIMDFGAFVNFLGARDGLVHISELAEHRVGKVSDVISEGDKVKVKVLAIDARGKVKLSMKVVDQSTGEKIDVKKKGSNVETVGSETSAE